LCFNFGSSTLFLFCLLGLTVELNANHAPTTTHAHPHSTNEMTDQLTRSSVDSIQQDEVVLHALRVCVSLRSESQALRSQSYIKTGVACARTSGVSPRPDAHACPYARMLRLPCMRLQLLRLLARPRMLLSIHMMLRARTCCYACSWGPPTPT
jgi:hypothetical protein